MPNYGYICIHFAATEHEKNCAHPKKTGAEVMLALESTEANQCEEKKLFTTLIELLSYEKIIFNGKNQRVLQIYIHMNEYMWHEKHYSEFINWIKQQKLKYIITLNVTIYNFSFA